MDNIHKLLFLSGDYCLRNVTKYIENQLYENSVQELVLM